MTYTIQIDGTTYETDQSVITHDDIALLVGKKADEFAVNIKLEGGRRIRLRDSDGEVDLSTMIYAGEPIDRLETIRKQAQQGSA